MSKSKVYNKIIVGDDIQHLLVNDQKTNKFSLSNDPIAIGKERLKIALYFFVFFFVIFSIRNTFLSVFPGDVISEPKFSSSFKLISNFFVLAVILSSALNSADLLSSHSEFET